MQVGKYKLKQHQIEAVESDAHFKFVGAGGGKTTIALVIANKYLEAGLVDNILVVTTKTQAVASTQFKRDWVHDYIMLFGKTPKTSYLNNDDDNFGDFYSNELSITSHYHGYLQKIYENYDVSRTFIIFDEVHFLKNPGEFKRKKLDSGKAGYYAARLARKCAMFVGLTATPSGGKWFDYANYLIMQDTISDTQEFKDKFCIVGTLEYAYNKFAKNQVLGYKNLPALQSEIKKMAYVFGNVEAITGINIDEHYKSCLIDIDAVKTVKKFMEYTPYNGETILIDTNASLIHKSRLIGDGINKEISSKSKQVWDLVYEQNIGRTIVIYNFTEEYENIRRTIDLYNKTTDQPLTYKTINGETKELDYETNLVDVLIVQIKAGGVGLNMKDYTNIIYYSAPYSYTDYKQSLGRNNRLNQKKDINRYYLTSVVDDRIYERLKEKKEVDVNDSDTYDAIFADL